MYQSEFHPVSFVVDLSAPDKIQIDRWAQILDYYISAYSKEITKKKNAYIGHIKAISIINKNDYIKLSIYKKDIPAAIDKKGESKISNICVSINSFVYRVNYEETIKIFQNVSNVMEKQFLIKTIINVSKDNHHQHA